MLMTAAQRRNLTTLWNAGGRATHCRGKCDVKGLQIGTMFRLARMGLVEITSAPKSYTFALTEAGLAEMRS